MSEKWESRILDELKKCNVFIPIITPHFLKSMWMDQEAGIAMASEDTKIIPLFSKVKPHGFLNKFQGELLNTRNVSRACDVIIDTLKKDDIFKDISKLS